MMPGMNSTNWNFSKNGLSSGSALILAVVLTSMLAIVGVLFVMMARVDKVATSAIVENRELNLAIETVIAKISQQLVWDVPGVVAVQEYYDYPDANNAWLASLEPYSSGGNYYWRHISDVNNQLGLWARDLPAVIVPDYQDPCDVSNVVGLFADADGDGVADSRWVIIPDMTSSKGEPIFAAIRIVDNEAMLNVNTGFKFDPNVVDVNLIDGSSQLQINLMALSWRTGVTFYDPCDEIDLLEARANPALGLNPLDLYQYEQNVIWRYYRPSGPYTPFDIGDDLELRNRFLVNHEDIRTRIEDGANLWTWSFNSPSELNTPVERGGRKNVDDWFWRAQHDVLGPNDVYSYRHIGTTYNMDRIIDPNGDRMININRETSAPRIYDKLLRSIYPVIASPLIHQRFAQLAVNMVDFADEDDNNLDGLLDINCVTTFFDASTGIIHCGFEAQPFITEIAWKIGSSPSVGDNYFALELYNPFNKVIDLNDFALELVNRNDPAERYYITFPENLDGTPIVFINPNNYCVIVNEAGRFSIYSSLDPNATTTIRVDPRLRFFEDWMSLDRSEPPVDRRPDPDKSKPPIPEGWGKSYDVFLKRRVFVPALGTVQWIYVDRELIEPYWAPKGRDKFYGRTQYDWHVVYQTPTIIEDRPYLAGVGRLGTWNNIPPTLFPSHYFSFFLPNPLYPRARFITVGDIPRILTLGHGVEPNSTIGQQLGTKLRSEEYQVRLDLANPYHRNVFQYLTVFDPVSDYIDNDDDGLGIDLNSDGFLDITEIDIDEVKIPGRININTAPWYVLAQLPWVSQRIGQVTDRKLAQAIVAYRDKTFVPGGPDYTIRPGAQGFGSIGELNFVTAPDPNYSIGQYMFDSWDLGTELLSHPGFPDLTTDGLGLGDGIEGDFEERDVIFSRISNLVSVRSDVFTAYILVRIGADGPQKRVVAILDRSGVSKTNVSSPDGKVRIVALHYVPDPR